MKDYLPITFLMLFFISLGLINIFQKINEDLPLTKLDYIIPMIFPIGLIFIAFIILIVKLSIPKNKEDKEK
ncbi:hypothetical protein [Alishewanella sp. HL-SH06]|uniref:hypothetical protein n=1 Tax=Alishewanella sp. HL-SH06 TaxID=3461144 RepID=UPI00404391C1